MSEPLPQGNGRVAPASEEERCIRHVGRTTATPALARHSNSLALTHSLRHSVSTKTGFQPFSFKYRFNENKKGAVSNGSAFGWVYSG